MTLTADDIMGMDSGNRWGDEPTEPEFKVPGDFRRTGRNGPPRVSNPDPDAKITKSGERKGRPELVTYGRPSGYAEQCEPKELGYGKQKWAERCLVNGFGRDVTLSTRAAELARAATSINVSHQDTEWRKKADGIFKAAFRAGGGEVASSRGTHIHTLIEDEVNGISWACKVAAGHDLGLPTDVQTAMVEAFQQCCADNGLTILGTELKLINDRLRLAGSADYMVEMSRPLDFIHDGEIVTVGTEGAKVGDAKGLALDTPIPTPTGWTTMGELKIGDQVVGSNGRPCTVVDKSGLRDVDCYHLSIDRGIDIVADADHRWAVEIGLRPEKNRRVMTTREIAESLFDKKGQRQIRILSPEPIEFPRADLALDPYVLGAWLGDGKRTSGEITKPAEHGMWAEFERRGYRLGKAPVDNGKCQTRTVLDIRGPLNVIGVFGDKHVPDIYKRASKTQRLDLIRGLMDSDGTWNIKRDRASFRVTRKQLAIDMYELLASLGERPTLSESTAKGFGLEVAVHGVEWTPLRFNPFLASHNADRAIVCNTGRNDCRIVRSCEPTPRVPTQCISVDSPDHTYLCTESMIVTHNTGHLGIGYLMSMAVYAESCLYDTEAEVRMPMPWEVDQQWGLIFHVPVTAAMEGQARCDLVLVDLEHGRLMNDLTLGLVRAHERGARFAPRFLTDVPRAEPGAVASSEPRRETVESLNLVASRARQRLTVDVMRLRMSTMDSTNDPFDGLVDSAAPTWGDMVASPESRAYIAERTLTLFRQSPAHAKAAAARVAEAGIPKLSESDGHTNAQIQRIEHEVAVAESAAAAETPITWNVTAPPVGDLDEGRTLTDAEFNAALGAYKQLDARAKLTVDAWATEALASGFATKLSEHRSLRRMRNLELRIALADVDPDMARAAIAFALDADWPHLPTIPFGAVLAGLAIAEVEHLLKFAASLDDVEYRFDGRGVLVLAA